MAPSDGNDVGELKYRTMPDYSPPLGDDYRLHLAVTGAHYKTGYGYAYDEVPDGDENRFYVSTWWDNRPEQECENCSCNPCCEWTDTASAVNLYTGFVSQTPGGVTDFNSYYPNETTEDKREYPVEVSFSLGSIIGIGIGYDDSSDGVSYYPDESLEYDMGITDLPAPVSQEDGVGFETNIEGDGAGYSEDTVDFEVYSEFDYRMGCTSYRYASTEEFRFTVEMDLV